MKGLIALALLLVALSGARAQQADTTMGSRFISGKQDSWVLRFAPLSLADVVETNVSFGAEWPVGNRLSISADVSYLFYSIYFSDRKSTSGILLRPGLRYYTADRHFLFLEVQPFFKQVNNRMEDWLGKDCINGVPVYESYQRFNLQKRVYGVNVQVGLAFPVSRDKKFRIELYQGLGVRTKMLDIQHDPRACLVNEGIFRTTSFHRWQVLPGFPAGVRLSYAFARR